LINSLMTIVEETLRSQRSAWAEITERVSRIAVREMPPKGPKRILLFGLGSSHYVARLIAFSLVRDHNRTRVPVHAVSSMAIGTEITPCPGDWAFAFSHRGGSEPTRRALEICDNSGADTFLICGKNAKPISNAKYTIETVPLERIEPHTIAVTSAVCAATNLLFGPKVMEEWETLSKEQELDLNILRDRAALGPTIMLGEWEGEWLAREGALKLMEMAKLPVRVFGTEEFFHGPRFSLKNEDRIWHMKVCGDQRQVEATNVIDVHPGLVGWVKALVELQWLALATSLNSVVDPDKV